MRHIYQLRACSIRLGHATRVDSCVSTLFAFFFQAEDGIRDGHVTGVQTCALPIWDTFTPPRWIGLENYTTLLFDDPVFRKVMFNTFFYSLISVPLGMRSEERRVGKECRYRWWRNV